MFVNKLLAPFFGIFEEKQLICYEVCWDSLNLLLLGGPACLEPLQWVTLLVLPAGEFWAVWHTKGFYN